MKFYNREPELAELQKLWKQSETRGTLAVLTGRRRLGKTSLATEFAKDLPFFYFFAEKKPEALLCQDYLPMMQKKLPFPVVGEITRFKDIFTLLLEYSKKERIVVILDEFQEFYHINPAVYSEMQNLWDAYKSQSKMLLIAVGSVYSLMYKIFEDKKEPLFGRSDRTLKLAPFSIPTLASLLKDHNITDLRDLFDFYVLTGAVPKYLDLFMTNGVRSKETILDFILSEFSPLLEEGKSLLIEEFGKEYGTYFAILELISMGKTSRPEIESILGCSVGGYVKKLEETYNLIYRILPFYRNNLKNREFGKEAPQNLDSERANIAGWQGASENQDSEGKPTPPKTDSSGCFGSNEKPASRLLKFAIKDPFLTFWFRFLYKNWSAVELKNFEYIRRIIDRDYSTYCGRFLERFFLELLAGQKKYNRIGTYWEAKNLNEIDIVAVNDLDKQLFIAEVKLNPHKFNMKTLQAKAQNLLKNYPDYQVEWAGLSLENAKDYLPGTKSI